ncbi:MAG: BrnT family toxin [Lamprobacter sp.]|uniref:BrnT family toxin n=1 Tax=Chromatiaceae TaxID=1046 RepID=UPI002B25EF31|nr:MULTISPECIES: BrnT family toxin [Chromatiaceae]MEA3643623.1 BrnT family toxin [Lamprobacter sp.]
MYFEWDWRKATENARKHGISFPEATEVFGDNFSSCVPDPDNSYGEERFLLFGKTKSGKGLAVSFTEKQDIIRIISARRMTAFERKAYEQ